MVWKNERGAAMVFVMILIVILFFYGLASWQNNQNDFQHATRDEKKTQAYYLAKAGVNAVEKWIRTEPDQLSTILNKTSEPVSMGAGSFVVEVIEEDANLITIRSTGRVGQVTDTISLTFNLTSENESYFSMALFSATTLNLSGSARVNGPVVTNASSVGSINLGWSTEINGDVLIGPDGDASEVISVPGKKSDPEDFINGSIGQLITPRSYTMPDFPDFPTGLPTPADSGPISNGDLVVGNWPYQDYTVSGSGSYDTIELRSNGSLTFNVGSGEQIIVVNDLNIQQGNVYIQGSGKLTLYVRDSFNLGGSSKFNAYGDTEDVMLYYKGTDEIRLGGSTQYVGSIFLESGDLDLGGSNTVTGHIISGGDSIEVRGSSSADVRVFYAPNATINVQGSGSLRGIVVANEINASGSAEITFVESAMDTFPVEIEDGGGSSDDEQRYWH